ncbi:MAG: sugar phosphate isomerase/epimerase [Planctomycetota bacterium]|nr:sugar phosphate isomerase/epimerase [Planctomycetota bacterium]
MTRTDPRLAVCLDDFGAPPKEALRAASEIGFRCVQIGALQGPISPSQLDESGRRHLRRFAEGLGLQIIALRVDFGGSRFLDASRTDYCIDRTRRVLELARELNVPTVSAPLGKFRTADVQEYELVMSAVRAVADHADLLNCSFAIETAVDTPDALQKLLREVSCPHLKVAYDPAELLIGGIDPLAPIETYADDIALAFARDAERGTSAQPGRETNLGAGHLSLPVYLAQLDAAGYRGPLVVRRADTTRPVADLAACKEYLESILTTGATQ